MQPLPFSDHIFAMLRYFGQDSAHILSADANNPINDYFIDPKETDFRFTALPKYVNVRRRVIV